VLETFAGHVTLIGMTPQDDAALEVVRRAIDDSTNKSLKRTLCACLLLSSVPGNSKPVRYVACAAVGATASHYWHVLMSVLAHLART
jgi:hypothetical protein